MKLQPKSYPEEKNLEYLEFESDIRRITNVYSGSRDCEKYLNRFTRETDQSFEYRTNVMTLQNYVQRTVDSSTSLIHRKQPVIEGDASEEENNDLKSLAVELTKLVIRDGIAFLVIDSNSTGQALTRADELIFGIKPYMYAVDRLSVLNWSYDDSGEFDHVTVGEKYVTYVGFRQEIREQYRVFKRGSIELWREGEIVEVFETGVDYVPVVKIGLDNVPKLNDLAKMNIDHMNLLSEKRRYLRIAASPVPVLYGSELDTDLVVGVDTVLSFRDKSEGGFEWVEMSGSAIGILSAEQQKLEEMMADEAIRLVSNSKDDKIRTAAQVNAELSETESYLSKVAYIVEHGLNRGLDILRDFGGFSAVVEINRDFSSNILSSDQVSSYKDLYLSGAITLRTLLQILVDGEVLPEDLNIDQEVAGITVGGGL